jgi:hypothetical protein
MSTEAVFHSDMSFQEFVKLRSRGDTASCLKTFARLKDVQITEDPGKELVAGHWLAVIVIQGEAVRIVLKVQSESQPVAELFAKTMRADPADVSNQQVKDFLREVCNLAAGVTKKGLAQCGIDTGISLPLATRGFDNLFFRSSAGPGTIEDRWKLTWEGGTLRCYSSVDILNEGQLKEFQYKDEEPEEDLFDNL